MFGNSININNFNGNPVVFKLVKPLKIAILGPNLYKKGVTMGQAQNKKQFFAEITKADLSFQKLSILSKYYMF